MLLLAAVVVVAGQWRTISSEIRFAGLVASLLAVYFTAEAIRRRLPSTATALATLAATLTAPVGVAAASTLDQPWPICTFAGGIAALIATELQSRRWEVPVLKAAMTVAAALTAAGLAALTGAPVALLGACAAGLFLLVGFQKRSIVLGAAVGATPGLLALAEAGVGAGTLERLGATGDVVDWAAPISSAIAAAVIAVSAHRRREVGLVVISLTTLSAGGFLGLVRADLDPFVWWCGPAAVLMAIELVSLLGGRTIWREAADRLLASLLEPIAISATIAGGVVLAVWLDGFGTVIEPDPMLIYPLGCTAAALWMAAAGANRRAQSSATFTALFAAASGATLAAIASLGSGDFGWSEVATVAALAALTGIVGHARHTPWWLHTAALGMVASGGLSLGLLHVGVDTATLALLVAGAALTGIAFLRADVTPLDTAVFATSALAVLIGLLASPVVISITFTVVAAQVVMYALARLEHLVAACAGTVLVASLVSLWWTTGTNDLVIDAIASYGADGGDIALAVATVVMVITGGLVRRMQTVSTWLAYSPGLGMAAAWLLDAQLDGDGTWATVAALTIGVIATGIGGFRRLGAPLLIGTGLVGATALASAGPRLATAPTWIWIASGGLGLLVLAAAIERTDRPLISSGPDDDARSVLEQFRHDFE